MLNHVSTIWEYRDFLTIHKSHLDLSQLKLLKSKYRPALSGTTSRKRTHKIDKF